MSKIVYLAALSLSVTAAMAQGIDEFTEQLAIVERNDEVEPFRYSSVVIHPDSSAYAAQLLFEEQSREELGEGVTSPSKRGYRIGLFFNNSATARSEAMGVMQLCDSLLTDLVATMSYDNPYFKVSVGYCTTQEEAVMMLHRVQRVFPRAYLMRESVTPTHIITSRLAETEAHRRKEEEEALLNQSEQSEE